jgi:hypothetical protein
VKPRFQADNDLRSSIRTGVLRHEPSIDFQSALAARLDGIPLELPDPARSGEAERVGICSIAMLLSPHPERHE